MTKTSAFLFDEVCDPLDHRRSILLVLGAFGDCFHLSLLKVNPEPRRNSVKMGFMCFGVQKLFLIEEVLYKPMGKEEHDPMKHKEIGNPLECLI